VWIWAVYAGNAQCIGERSQALRPCFLGREAVHVEAILYFGPTQRRGCFIRVLAPSFDFSLLEGNSYWCDEGIRLDISILRPVVTQKHTKTEHAGGSRTGHMARCSVSSYLVTTQCIAFISRNILVCCKT
jgi:hypothetical protein